MSGRRIIAIIVGIVGLFLLLAIAYLLLFQPEDAPEVTPEEVAETGAVEQAETPEKRAGLNALNGEGRRKIAKLYQEQKAEKYIEDKAPKGNRILDRKP